MNVLYADDYKPTFQRRTPEEYLEYIRQQNRGQLKLYVGAAPGVGKSYKMLLDAREMKKDGTDIVIGLIETHGRKETEDAIADLEKVPLKEIDYKGKLFYELDVEGIIKRAPQVVVVDELAHSNIPSSKNKKRYMDVQELLEAGISVLSAFNIQHLESVHDIVAQITNVKVRERIPDFILQKANEIQLVDATPEVLRKRLIDGKIYKEEKIQQSLQNFFTLNNLGALRELSLREVADDMDEKISQTVIEPIGVKEKILVCVQYSSTAEKLIRRGWRMADRLNAELYVLNVERENIDSLSASKKQTIEEWKGLTNQFDASFVLEESKGRKPADVIIEVAKRLQVTQILLGQSARTRWEEIRKGSIVNEIMRQTKHIDIHIVADQRV
ncbi:KdpD-like non-kinase potassium sensor [Bacillus tropicus]|uniref:KdpD-like non-kinase potassium sensor n=1 Tax=Bacillus cereus group TaxID=86661 RepID=UPI000A0417A8|nr:MULTISPECIES: KdpD-like non-kinase potassium sensor [Bacillus cereus group]MDA1800241.1 KdpD-like non-kinase potassium sensor [Bacillus cereus group sp. BY6-1LC]MDF9554675.1 KdpD-like non-kinase potassium sensor [Bacillus tropicus]MDF9590711.1 KdpD-like non-kinase potassium sensor [Bacillus tropicus]MDF9649629.1 KdpD-like non-kinase potassium sensor [Bacillus tropicus]HDR7799949.1 KdpD-like non-kinase potassium sensor [Bacillus tropicus]